MWPYPSIRIPDDLPMVNLRSRPTQPDVSAPALLPRGARVARRAAPWYGNPRGPLVGERLRCPAPEAVTQVMYCLSICTWEASQVLRIGGSDSGTLTIPVPVIEPSTILSACPVAHLEILARPFPIT